MMFSLSEKLIAPVAPHVCLLCNKEGRIVCDDCFPGLNQPRRSACFMCNALTDDFKTCDACRRKTDLKRVWVSTRYEAYVKQLIKAYKFDRARSAHSPLARLIADTVISVDYDLIVPVPSVTSHLRRRGYNPAGLIARDVSRLLGVRYASVLGRYGQVHQVGHSREDRLKQLDKSIYLAKGLPENTKILLVDDVVTTGATLHHCAKVLKQSGAKRIEAAVIASS